MRTKFIELILIVALITPHSAYPVRAQGKVTFDQPWVLPNHAHYLWWYTDTTGWKVSISPQVPDNYVVRLLSLHGYPTNQSPYLVHVRFAGIQSLTIISPTNISVFGLSSVDLADPVAPSPAPIDITFNGFKADGSMVSQTFTVGGGGSSSFQTFYFGPAFAHGLLRVEIPSPAWAMDNLVWIPEPSALALLIAGSAGLLLRRFRRQTPNR